MTILTFEDGVVKLGDAEFPGILRSLSVSGYVRFDEQEVAIYRNGRKSHDGR